MRHLVAGRKLNADTQHRLAMRRNLARSLFLHGRITTTVAKAKATRPFVEKLVTRARRADAAKTADRALYVHHLRVLRRDLPERKVLKLLVEQIAPLCRDRAGGYTRILKDPQAQVGDRAPRAIFEFVDRPAAPAAPEGAKTAAKKAPKAKGASARGGTRRTSSPAGTGAAGKGRAKEAAPD